MPSPNVFVAFPVDTLAGISLADRNILSSMLTVDGRQYITVLKKNVKEVCELLNLTVAHITLSRSPYQGISIADFSEAEKAEKPVEKKMKRPAKKPRAPKKPVQNSKISEASRKKWVELCDAESSKNEDEIIEIKNEINSLKDDLHRIQKELVDKIREIEEKNKEIKKLQLPKTGGPEQFLCELEQLLTHPDITKIEVKRDVYGSEQTLNVFTGPITIEYESKTYNIGRFRIKIDPEGEDGCVKMFNLTRKPDGYNHPHVDGDGNPCLGNISEVVPNLVGERKYAAVISICIQYLKTYTDDSFNYPHNKIGNWPLAKSKREK